MGSQSSGPSPLFQPEQLFHFLQIKSQVRIHFYECNIFLVLSIKTTAAAHLEAKILRIGVCNSGSEN